ncbi:MAG TPA: MtrB/PioB family outer membrane beta-barrel protein, partial [Thermoanaerobaculia bacterium]|nr:MtrB/PioB family outer membrane beta-barrel protein [Thermoanaerobaculia bacterium]
FHGDDLLLRSSVEAGWLFERGDDHEARFTEFSDLSDGFLLRRFSLEGRQKTGLGHFTLEGGSVARDDAFYRIDLGRTGVFRLRGRYDAVPHVYADDARILYRGVGTESLHLPPGLVPGANRAPEIDAALSRLGDRRLVQQRDDSTLDLRLRLRPDLVWTAGYHLDRRHGERYFGGTLGTTFGSTNSGSVTELLEPLQSRTHEGTTSLEFSTRRLQADLRYRASFYLNGRDSLTWENPFAATDLGFLLVPGEPLGRSALPPDNASHQVSGNLATVVPWHGRFVVSGAWTRMQQDQRLLPATINTDLTSFADLSRRRADARVDTWMLQSKLRARPLAPVDIHLDFRVFDRDGDTNYTAFDPATGQYGYVVEDLSPTSRVGAPLFSYRRWNLAAGTDWRVTRKSRIGVEWAHEETRRSNRARQLTRDDRLRLRSTTRIFAQGTMRVSYDYSKRTGSHYDPGRDSAYYAASPLATGLAGPARALRPFRQFDLARSQGHELEWRSNFPLGRAADLAFTARYRQRDYATNYGVRDEMGADVGVDASYLPSPRTELHLFTSYEWRDRRLKTIDSVPGPIVSLSAGGPTFPFVNAWSWDSRVETMTMGTGFNARPFRSISLELDYRLLFSRERVETDFDRTGGALSSGIDPTTAQRGYAPERLFDHVLTISATKRWSEGLSTRLLYRMQDSTIESAQQTGTPRVNQNLYLGTLDDDFRVHLVALTAEFRY